nr:hypothetical protein [Tanacetum cinerariifolium]
KDLDEARKKKKKSLESPKMPHGSPPHQPPPPPPPAGPSGASGSSGASRSSQGPPPPPSNTQKDLQMDEDMAPDEQAQSSDDEDIVSAHIHKASALASNYSPPPEDSLLAQTGDIAMFMDWFCKRRGITELKPQDLEGPAFDIVKVFHPDVIHLQYQMEECHKLLTDSVDNSILRHNVSKPLLLGGPPGQQMVPDQIWIEEECKYDIAAMYGISHWWFQRERFYIDRHASEGDRSAVRTHMRILSVVRIKSFPCMGHLNHLPPKDKKILTTAVNQWTRHLVIRQRVKDFQLGIESYQTQLNLTKPRWDATVFEYKHNYTVIDSPRAVTFRDRYGVQMIMRFNEIHKFSDGTLQ